MTAEPQSIIHHVIRLERKIVQSLVVSPRRRGRKNAKKGKCNSQDDLHKDSSDLTGNSLCAIEDTVGTQPLHSDDDDDDTYSLGSDYDATYGVYRTINQNEVFQECFGPCDDCIMIHFFSEHEAQQCEFIDSELSVLATKHMSCKFLRINGRLAPFFTAKLNVKALPSVVCIRSGEVLSCLSVFDTDKTGFLEDWLLASGLIVLPHST